MLTWDHTNLVREITTPALPAFISSCLSNVEKHSFPSHELQTVLEAFATLIPRHPTIFRTHESQIRSLVFEVLSPLDGAPLFHTQSQKHAAQRLLVLLHHCAPKQGGSDKWDETFIATVMVAHTTCDRLFGSAVEAWQSVASVQNVASTAALSGLESEDMFEELSGCKAIYGDSDRLITLLGILKSHFETATTNTVSVRVGLVLDLLSRLFSITTQSAQPKTDTPKDEREALVSTLPGIHIAALELADALMERFGYSSMPLLQSLSESIVDVYRSESSHASIRAATYRTFQKYMGLTGTSLGRDDVVEFASLIQGCCNDLLPAGIKGTDELISKVNNRSTNTDAVSRSHSSHSNDTTPYEDLKNAAAALLPHFFSQINPAYMFPKIRMQMDRTAILTRNKESLMVSVLNPARKDDRGSVQTSLLPLLAREYPNSSAVETLLRPRMPLVSTRPSNVGEDDINGYEDLEDDAIDGAMNGQNNDEGERDGVDDQLSTKPLHTLDRNEDLAPTQQEDEDLYSATPPSAPSHLDSTTLAMSAETAIPPNGHFSTKRAAADPTGAELSAKRLRASPAAEAFADSSSAALSGPDSPSVEAQLPFTAVVEQPVMENISENTVTLPSAQTATLLAGATEPTNLDMGSDDSDFELPPLTMEPDTDPEDEDEDEEDER